MANKGLEKAYSAAFLLLKYRPRSVREMADRLRRRKFPPEVIEEVLGSLQAKKFLDDKAFTRAWVDSRAGQRFGERRIRQELRLKGIAPELINESMDELRGRCPEGETIEESAREKLRKLKDLDPQTAKRRLYSYFLRRGFSPETVIDTINRLIS